MKCQTFSAVLAMLFLSLISVKIQAEEIGKVVLAQGSPLVVRAGQHLFIKRNDRLYQSDRIITPVGSRILFRLKDKTTISLAENTEFELSEYRLSKSDSSVNFRMLKGAFRTLTGTIGTHKEPHFEIHTPVATIGVRGTEFWGGMIFSDALDVTMLEGKGVYIKNEYGQVEITNPGDGTVVIPGEKPSPVTHWTEDKLKQAAEATHLNDISNGYEPNY